MYRIDETGFAHPPSRAHTACHPMAAMTKVKVGNVHHDATPALLRSFFEFHGQILRTQ